MPKQYTIKNFLDDARRVHGDRYNYSKVDYYKSIIKVCIICPDHGEFWQTPSHHIGNKQGCPKCCYEKRKRKVFGVGVNDFDRVIKAGSRETLAYKTWGSMLRRCYSSKYQATKPTYIGCSVCDEWKNFSTFKEWFDKNYVDGFVLDKDILVQGNTVYSPSTCRFVPKPINQLLVNSKNKGDRKVGSYFHKGKYHVQCWINGKQTYLGRFDNEAAAHEAYKNAKYNEIRRVATDYLYKGEIGVDIYNALLNYKID